MLLYCQDGAVYWECEGGEDKGSPSNLEDDDTASPSSNSSGDECHTAAFTPKRPTVNPTIPKDILKKMGPAADRLNIPNATLTGLLAAVINNSGGDIGDITLSTSSARLHRAAARKELAVTVREEFSWSLLNWSWVTRLQGRMDSSSTCLVLGLTITPDGWAKPSMYWRWFCCNTSFLIYTGSLRRRWRRWRSLWCLSIWGRGSLLPGSPQLHRMIFYSAKVLLSTRRSIMVCPARLWQSSTDTPGILQKI